jgi:2'-5' RNA ligase
MESIRAFVAVGLGQELKQELRAVQLKLQEESKARVIRWVAPENIHLTFKFLGEVDASRMVELTGALEKSTEGFTPFALTVRGLGSFPNARHPNVIWAGLNSQVARAIELARRVEDTFGLLGFPQEPRPFSPHLTLGRIKREVRQPDRAAIGAAAERFPVRDYGVIVVDALHLIRSELRPDGPLYTSLATAHLDDSLPRPP